MDSRLNSIDLISVSIVSLFHFVNEPDELSPWLSQHYKHCPSYYYYYYY